ncbi:MAG: uracil-DNA glycosylase [Holophagales bacterium]|nr:uracil-DNA glycosylase [Holophagales bacterium]
MAENLPRPLGDVLSYLEGLGFDHLYGSRPDSAGPLAPATDPAASAPTKEAGGTRARGAERLTGLDRWRARALACTACPLSQGRRHVVFGDGYPDADLMFVGEGPGAEEDRKGLPFVGPAGALLTRIIHAIEMRREEVYIANVVKCRPPRNRDPMPEEVAACRSFLEAQIELIRPKVLVALGRVAAQALLGTDAPLRDLRGRWHRVREVDTRVTYHPAALLRNVAYKRPTWEDMQIVRDRLRELG